MWVRAKLAALLGCAALLFGCSSAERAVRVTVVLRTPTDDVCLTAREEGATARVVFHTAYPSATLPTPATLTFVAGPTFAGSVDLTARGVLAGSFVGGATINTPLSMQGTTEATLPVDRCRVRGTAGFGMRPAGTFAALHDPPRTIATDYDADGRDELLAIAADGTMVVLDAENVAQGSRRESELLATDGVLVRAGDLDLDCRADVIATAGSGALVVSSNDGRSPPPIGTPPRDVAIGRVARTAPLRLVLGGASGLTLIALPGATGTPTTLSTTPMAHVVSWDADGDGGTEIIATGAMGLLAFATMTGAETDVTTLMPTGYAMFHGPLGVGDVDDDDDADLVVADAATIHVALRSAAHWADASGTMITTLDAPVARLEVADVDGDCGDDVIAISTSGTVYAYRVRTTGGLTLIDMMPSWLDFAVGDFDGDGSKEIALVGTGGRVTLWQP